MEFDRTFITDGNTFGIIALNIDAAETDIFCLSPE
jgi:hypothetical protein